MGYLLLQLSDLLIVAGKCCLVCNSHGLSYICEPGCILNLQIAEVATRISLLEDITNKIIAITLYCDDPIININ